VPPRLNGPRSRTRSTRGITPGILRTPAVLAVAAVALSACGGATSEPAAVAPSSAPTSTAAAPTAGSATAVGDPCNLLQADVINQTLGTTVGDGASKPDEARQIVTCTWNQDDMLALVNVGLAQIDGTEAFKTNKDLAPAYFNGDPQPITIPGTETAYIVLDKELDNSPVVGMLIHGSFVLMQATAPGITKEQGIELATRVAQNMNA
jgi:Protein of unknown function (DUF3558)